MKSRKTALSIVFMFFLILNNCGGDTESGGASTANLVSIQVTPSMASIAIGTKQKFIATGIYTDISTQDLTDSVTWTTTAGSGSATINANGLSTGTAPGDVNVTATNGGGSGIKGTATLTVRRPRWSLLR